MNPCIERATASNRDAYPFFLMLALITLSAILLAAPAVAETAETADTEQACPTDMHGENGCPCPHHGMHGSHHGTLDGESDAGGMGMYDRMGEELALSDDQKQQMAALIEMYRPRIQELFERGSVARRDLMSMAPDDSQYNQRSSEVSQLASLSAAEMVILLSELQANAYALLSAEQKVRFMELRAEQQAKMEQKKAEMEERRKMGGEMPMTMNMGMHMGMSHEDGETTSHQCKACEWLKQDDARLAEQESAE